MRFLLVTIIVSLCACGHSPRKEVADSIFHEKYNDRYQQLVQIIKTSASPEEFKELREIYIHTEYYKPYLGPDRSLTASMFGGLNEKNWEMCIGSANKILKNNYISLSAHYGAMVCHYEAGHELKGKFHRYVLSGLIEAIWASGDGESIETAFYCTSTPELQAFIQLQGLELVDQSLVHKNGKAYDLMGVKDPKENKEFKWYFDISAQWTMGLAEIK